MLKLNARKIQKSYFVHIICIYKKNQDCNLSAIAKKRKVILYI